MESLFLPLLAGCLVALASALAVALARRPIYAAVALLAHSLSLAGLFALLAAEMAAVGQIIIYSGAIVVLFLFVVTLLPTAGGILARPNRGQVASALVAFAALVASLGAATTTIPTPGTEGAGTVPQVGRALFGPLLVAFELTAPLLLVAIIGGVAIWRRHEPTPRRATEAVRTHGPRHVVINR